MENKSLKQMLTELKEISNWFEDQSEPDIEKGLEKVRRGAELIKQSREKLKEVENEFEEIKKDITLEEDTSEETPF